TQTIPTITQETLHPEMANNNGMNTQNTAVETPSNITFNGVPNVEDVLEEPEELDLTGIQLQSEPEVKPEVSPVSSTSSQNNFFQFGFDQPAPTTAPEPTVEIVQEQKVAPVMPQESIAPVTPVQPVEPAVSGNNGIVE